MTFPAVVEWVICGQLTNGHWPHCTAPAEVFFKKNSAGAGGIKVKTTKDKP